MIELKLLKKPVYVVPNHLSIYGTAILCSGIAIYIGQPGGRVRHPEFRPSETPTPPSETDHLDK
jgi:hypothetical protein